MLSSYKERIRVIYFSSLEKRKKLIVVASAYDNELIWHNFDLTKNYDSRHKTAIEGYPFLVILIER